MLSTRRLLEIRVGLHNSQLTKPPALISSNIIKTSRRDHDTRSLASAVSASRLKSISNRAVFYTNPSTKSESHDLISNFELKPLKRLESLFETNKTQNSLYSDDSINAPNEDFDTYTFKKHNHNSRREAFLNRNNQKDDFYLPMYFRLPQRISRYPYNTESDRIGAGYFAEVFKAKDMITGKHVALKSIDKSKYVKELFEQELNLMQFIRQVYSQSPTKLANLALAKDIFETSNNLFFVFQLCEGGDLYDYVEKHGPVNEKTAKLIIRQILSGLGAIHECGVIHRDIKLENILLEKHNDLSSLKITDFGYAKKENGEDVFKNPAGTFGYVAPEILKNRLYTQKCDVWSLGIILWTILAGHPPFPYLNGLDSLDGLSREEMMKKELEAIVEGRKEKNFMIELNSGRMRDMSPDVKDLLSNILQTNVHRRLSVDQILSHSWLSLVDNDSKLTEQEQIAM